MFFLEPLLVIYLNILVLIAFFNRCVLFLFLKRERGSDSMHSGNEMGDAHDAKKVCLFYLTDYQTSVCENF